MKAVIIFLIFNTFVIVQPDRFHSENIIPEVGIALCPEKNIKSLFLINAILTNPEMHDGMQLLGFDSATTGIDQSELLNKPDVPEFLRLYWKEHGVEQISDSEICKKITLELDANELNKPDLEKYDRVYYVINSRYIIFYHFKYPIISERNAPLPQIMDEHFRIIGELDLRESKGN